MPLGPCLFWICRLSKGKNTQLMTVSTETVRMAKSRPRKDQSERSDLPCHIIMCHIFNSPLHLVCGNVVKHAFFIRFIAWKLQVKSGSVPKQDKTNLWAFLQRHAISTVTKSYERPLPSTQCNINTILWVPLWVSQEDNRAATVCWWIWVYDFKMTCSP